MMCVYVCCVSVVYVFVLCVCMCAFCTRARRCYARACRRARRCCTSCVCVLRLLFAFHMGCMLCVLFAF